MEPLINKLVRWCTLYPAFAISWSGWLCYIASEFRGLSLNSVIFNFCYNHGLTLPDNMPPLAWLAQAMQFGSALLMMPAPIIARQWSNLAITTSVAISCIFPVLHVTLGLHWFVEFICRIGCTYLIIALLVLLGRVPAATFGRILNPRFWIEVLKGKHGADDCSVLGIEFLGWGFAIMDRSMILATAIALWGSVFLIRFGQMAQALGRPLGTQWLWLNIVGGCLRAVKFGAAIGVLTAVQTWAMVSALTDAAAGIVFSGTVGALVGVAVVLVLAAVVRHVFDQLPRQRAASQAC
jgi:hypothetical protein